MIVRDYRLNDNGNWEQLIAYDNGKTKWCGCVITDVPVVNLLIAWEDLVMELSEKEIKLYNLKEAYHIAEADIVNNTDFKALYGANNQKVRDNHVKNELSDMVADVKTLEFGINWIRQYIPLLREVIRWKQNNIPSINTPVTLDAAPMTIKDMERRKLIDDLLKESKQ